MVAHSTITVHNHEGEMVAHSMITVHMKVRWWLTTQSLYTPWNEMVAHRTVTVHMQVRWWLTAQSLYTPWNEMVAHNTITVHKASCAGTMFLFTITTAHTIHYTKQPNLGIENFNTNP